MLAARIGRGIAVAIPAAFLALFFLLPVAALIVNGLLPGERIPGIPAGDPILEILSRPETIRAVYRTIGQALVATVVAVVLGVPGAFVLYRTTFPGRRLLRAVVAVPFVLPTVVVGVAFRAVLAPSGMFGFLGLDRTAWSLIAALVFFNYSVVVRMVGPAWAALDPRAEQAARTLGAGPWRALRTVTLPALAPAIGSAAALVALFCMTSYGIVRSLGPIGWSTIETQIWQLDTRNLDLRGAAVLSIVQILVVVATMVLAGRFRSAPPRLRPHPPERLRLTSPRHLPAALLTAFVVVALIAAPMVGLVQRSLTGANGELTWQNYRNLAGTGNGALPRSVWDAAELSLRAAVDATVIAMVVGLLAAIVIARSRGGSALDTLVMLPIGVSAVTVGFGFILLAGWLPVDVRGNPMLVPIAQAVVAVPLVVRTVVPVLRSVHPRQREAASTLGATPLRVLRTIDGPHILRAGGVALGFAFAVSMGEFGATSFLARSTDPTLPVAVVRLLSRPGAESLGTGMAAAVVLAAITASVMAIAERARAEGDAGW
jgi:thiamine transport system permease protein